MREWSGFTYLCEPLVRRDGRARTIAIGKFDGLHLAHQAIAQTAVRKAQESGSTAALFSFTPHPRLVLRGDAAYARWLTPSAERARVARELGMEQTFVALFDRAFRTLTASEFLRAYLVPLCAIHIVVGYNFRFGRGGAYGTDDLREVAAQAGVGVDIVPPVHVAGRPVSSSEIRGRLAEGDVAGAAQSLGRPYRVRGRVVRGAGRGRSIGFPTANLEMLEDFVVPREGVYAVDCLIDGRVVRGAMNIGRRPTVCADGKLSLEVHLIGETVDLYGQEMTVSFLSYLRPEQKFPSIDALSRQLTVDAAHASALLGIQGARREANFLV